MRKLLFAFFMLFPNIIWSQVVINELMPSPNDGEPEWIELYNYSDADFSADTLLVSDTRTSAKIHAFNLKSKAFAIITKDKIALLEKRTVSNNAIILEATLPSLNNTGDTISIRSSIKQLDAVIYTSKYVKKGVSIERIDALEPSINGNLTLSCDTSGASSGTYNCNRALQYDLEICDFYQNKIKKTLDVKLYNIGKSSANGAEISIFCDKDKNMQFADDEMILTKNIPNIASKDSFLLEINLNEINSNLLKSGYYYFKAKIQFSEDENPANNSKTSEYYKAFAFETIRINEIMSRPADSSGRYIEIYNSSADTIDLSGFSLQEGITKKENKYLPIKNLIIYPASYALIAWDSTLYYSYPKLKDSINVYLSNWTYEINSDKDYIGIFDQSLELMDSCDYSESWHDPKLDNPKGVSLEKMNVLASSNIPNSWTSCVSLNGGTPLEQNSVNIKYESKLIIEIKPNPFSRKNTNQPYCQFTYTIPYKTAKINAEIFSEKGVSISKPLEAKYSGSIGEFKWDGIDKNNNEVPIGAYILYFEAIDGDTGESSIEKKIIVLGE